MPVKERVTKKVVKKKEIASQAISIHELNLKTLYLRLKGTSPLIVHKFNVKTIRQIEEKQQLGGKAKGKAKGARKPEDEFNGARYILNKKKKIDGFPASGFKKAAVRAGTFMGMKMTDSRGSFHVIGDLVPIACVKGPKMRTDMVRIGMGTSDVRYRPEYANWGCELEIRYNANVVSPEQIVNMFNTAGFSTGVGEWRPEKGGNFGMFEVVA